MVDQYPPGATPIDPDEAAELIPQHLQTLSDLNEWEQVNILAAQRWADHSRIPAISEQMVRELHRRMFDQTWRWAGRYSVRASSNSSIKCGWAAS